MRLVLCFAVSCGLAACGLTTVTPEPSAEQARQLIEDGHYPEAIAVARNHVEAVRADEGVDSLAAAEALDVLVVALVFGDREELDEALRLGRQALALKEKHTAPGTLTLADSLIGHRRAVAATDRGHRHRGHVQAGRCRPAGAAPGDPRLLS